MAQAPQNGYRKTPGEPAAGERRIHCLAQVPFRNWCSACVDGRLRDGKHAMTEDDKEAMPTVQFDICEPQTQAGVDAIGRAIEFGVKTNVGVDMRTGAVCTARSRGRGPEDEHQTQTMAQLTENIGHHSLILQAYPEGGMGAFIKRVYELRSKPALMRASPMERKGSQGVVEATHWSVEGLLRNMIIDHHSRTGDWLKPGDRLLD